MGHIEITHTRRKTPIIKVFTTQILTILCRADGAVVEYTRITIFIYIYI